MDQLRTGTLTIEKWKAEQQLRDATWPTEAAAVPVNSSPAR